MWSFQEALGFALALTSTSACAVPEHETMHTRSTAQALVAPSGSAPTPLVFPVVGGHISHTNAWLGDGQPATLSVTRSLDHPDGNSSLVVGDRYHAWSMLTGQVVAMSTSVSDDGNPGRGYFLLRDTDYLAALSTSMFEIADNLGGGYAWRLIPNITGTTSQQYGARVDQATIDMMNATTTLQVRSGATVLTETTPTILDGQTSLLVRKNTGGTLELSRVEVGSPDSCGTGYRCLRVPN